MKELKFELGQWVMTEDGYGQIMYIRPYFVEDYENHRQGKKNGEFIRYIYICKILCGFEGKIRKAKKINIYTSISLIDKEGLEHLKTIKNEQKEEYEKYILFDDKNFITKQLFLSFKLDKLDFDTDLVKKKLANMNDKLYPAFTFKEFSILFKEYEFPFKLENIIEYGQGNKNSIELRFDSYLYKTKDKEAVFHNVMVFFK